MQTNRWTRPSHEAALAVASGGLIKQRFSQTARRLQVAHNRAPYRVRIRSRVDAARLVVTFRDATSWLRTYAERCLWRTVTMVPVTANFLLIYCDVYVCLVWNFGPF